MERFCEKCGSLVNGDVKFCPVCGAPMKSAVDLGKADQQPVQPNYGYGNQPNYGNQPVYGSQQNYGYGAPQYGQNFTPGNVPSQTMTTGQWLGTILLCTCLGIISFILNIVWGFGSATPEPKRSFCRAMFIVNIISYVLAFITIAIVFSVLGDELNTYKYYYSF